MRLLLLTAAVAFAISGCDSTGLSGECLDCVVSSGGAGGSGHPGGSGGGTTGGSDGGTTGGTDGSGTGGSDGGTTGGSDGSGGSTGDVFLDVNPRQTYLRTQGDDALDAPAIRLADLKIAPGDVVCAAVVGDLFLGTGVRASEQGQPLITAVFSADDALEPSDRRVRVLKAIDAGADVTTLATNSGLLATDIAQDFEPAAGCVTVPDGARFVFLSAYDDYFADNTLADGSDRFGLIIKR